MEIVYPTSPFASGISPKLPKTVMACAFSHCFPHIEQSKIYPSLGLEVPAQTPAPSVLPPVTRMTSIDAAAVLVASASSTPSKPSEVQTPKSKPAKSSPPSASGSSSLKRKMKDTIDSDAESGNDSSDAEDNEGLSSKPPKSKSSKSSSSSSSDARISDEALERMSTGNSTLRKVLYKQLDELDELIGRESFDAEERESLIDQVLSGFHFVLTAYRDQGELAHYLRTGKGKEKTGKMVFEGQYSPPNCFITTASEKGKIRCPLARYRALTYTRALGIIAAHFDKGWITDQALELRGSLSECMRVSRKPQLFAPFKGSLTLLDKMLNYLLIDIEVKAQPQFPEDPAAYLASSIARQRQDAADLLHETLQQDVDPKDQDNWHLPESSFHPGRLTAARGRIGGRMRTVAEILCLIAEAQDKLSLGVRVKDLQSKKRKLEETLEKHSKVAKKQPRTDPFAYVHKHKSAGKRLPTGGKSIKKLPQGTTNSDNDEESGSDDSGSDDSGTSSGSSDEEEEEGDDTTVTRLD